MSNVLNVELTGTLPLLMHNERLANPLDPYTKALKALTTKRKKTDDDVEAISFAEFQGGLYHEDGVGPFIPAHVLSAMIRDGAKLTKQGRDVVRAVLVVEPKSPLIYTGPRDVEGLWKKGFFDRRMVGNQKARVLRTRPVFAKWGVKFTLQFDETVFDRAHIAPIIESAGRMCGIGDYRPAFGRFSAEVK